ncbi:hypothetical protein Vqi01_15360 [Micromonospora qiuiae]|uniref:Uncharacterized protein n=2 Tax=Micromonospora qiuiae TaxID=502268 RepID=A0ABQ4J879_9ACTN|nr:hypothetical protein Vqi01_15360 [Micromonospora qiuiae]
MTSPIPPTTPTEAPPTQTAQPPPATNVDTLTWEDGLTQVLQAPATNRHQFMGRPWITHVESEVIQYGSAGLGDYGRLEEHEFEFFHHIGGGSGTGLANSYASSAGRRNHLYLRVRGRLDWFVGDEGETPRARFNSDFWDLTDDALLRTPSPPPLDIQSFYAAERTVSNLAGWLEQGSAELQREIDSLGDGSGFTGDAAQAYHAALENLRRDMLVLRDDLEINRNWAELLRQAGDAAETFWREVRRTWDEWSIVSARVRGTFPVYHPGVMVRRALLGISDHIAQRRTGGVISIDIGNGRRDYDFTSPAGAQASLASLDRDMHAYFQERATVLDEAMRVQYVNLRNSFNDTTTNLLDPRGALPQSDGPGPGEPNLNVPDLLSDPPPGLFDGGGGVGDPLPGSFDGGGGVGDPLPGSFGGGGGVGDPPPGSFGVGGGVGDPLPGSLGGGFDLPASPGTGFDAGGLDGLDPTIGDAGPLPAGGFVGPPGLGGLLSPIGGRPVPGREQTGSGPNGIGTGDGDFQERPNAIDPRDLPGVGGSLPVLPGGSLEVGDLPGLPGVPGGTPGRDPLGAVPGNGGDGWLGGGAEPGSEARVPAGQMRLGPLSPAALQADGLADPDGGLAGLLGAPGNGLAGLDGAPGTGLAGLGGGPAGVGASTAGAGSAGYPFMPPMAPMGGAGAGGQQEKERERKTWLAEEEEVWGTDPDVAPSVIGRDEVPDGTGTEHTGASVPRTPDAPYGPARGTGQHSRRGY